jgi:hypothetical protein
MSMKYTAWACLAAGAVVVLAGCGSAAPLPPPPATVTHVPGSAVARLHLTSRAIERLGIATRPVQAAGGVAGRATSRGPASPRGHELIPYSAVIYDTDGSTWTYVNTGAGSYLREPITITGIRGNAAVLSSGPPPGAEVVTVGAAELLGTEYDISGEQ